MENFPLKISFSKSIGEINERLELLVSANQQLSSISRIACEKIGIPYNEQYTFLYSTRPLFMTSTIENSNIKQNDHLVLADLDIDNCNEYKYKSNTKAYQTVMWKPLAVVAFILSIGGLLTVLTLYIINLSSIYSYSIVIDAGSTSSKIFLYNWASNKFLYNADVVQLEMCKAQPGISSYEAEPNQSFELIKLCLDTKIIPKIPPNMKNSTYIYLGATAGMRMLSLNNMNASKQIMQVIRDSLQKYSFKVNNSLSDISIISGSQEGLYGWTTINFLLQNLPKKIEKNPNVIGALDMGGASTQITFVDKIPSNSSTTINLKLYGNTYSIYSHSYLCYGKSQAEIRFLAELIEASNFSTSITNPCMSKSESVIYGANYIFNVPCVWGQFAIDNYGHQIIPPNDWLTKNVNITFNGSGNYSSCSVNVRQLFNLSKCEYEHKSCTFNGVYQPEISGKFGAFSAYNLIQTVLNKNNDPLGLKEYTERLKNLCSSNYNNTLFDDPQENIYTKWLCFDIVYMIQMLLNLGFNEKNWNNIEFINKIGNSNAGWALGFMIDKTSLIPKEKHFLPIENYMFGILVAVLLIIMCFAITFTYFYYIRNKRNRSYVNNSKLIEEESLLS